MPVILIIIVLAVAALVIYNAYAKEQRRKSLAVWATTNRLQYWPDSERDMEQRFPAFDCLQQGDNRYAYNLIEGDWNQRGFAGFDYHYETHSTDSKGRRQTHHHRFSAVVLRSAIPLQPLFIRPENAFDKVKSFFGFEDINFESAEFSRRFFVKAPNKRWAYDVIHPRTMEFLLSQPDFSLQFDRYDIIAYRSETFEPAEFATAANIIAGILDRLPGYVVQQQRGA